MITRPFALLTTLCYDSPYKCKYETFGSRLSMNIDKDSKQRPKAAMTTKTSTKEQEQPKIIAAIPCYNEERFVGSVVLKAKEFANEVMVIDDGSTDQTALVAERAGAIVIKHDRNRGKGAAIRTAFEQARATGCSVLVLLDGDGQHEPVFIPSLVEPLRRGEADMVVGSRYLGIQSSIPRYRIWGHRVLTFLTNFGSRVKLTDSQSGYRAFSPKALESLSLAEEGLSVESEMQFLASEAGLKVLEIPITIAYYDKAKRNPIAHGLGVLNSILGFISRRAPLLFFGVPGTVMICFGVWEGSRVVQGYNLFHEFYIGPALLAVLLCIVGSLSLFTGMILHNIRSFFK